MCGHSQTLISAFDLLHQISTVFTHKSQEEIRKHALFLRHWKGSQTCLTPSALCPTQTRHLCHHEVQAGAGGERDGNRDGWRGLGDQAGVSPKARCVCVWREQGTVPTSGTGGRILAWRKETWGRLLSRSLRGQESEEGGGTLTKISERRGPGNKHFKGTEVTAFFICFPDCRIA